MKLVLTCEHAGNIIPREYEEHFFNFEKELNSHRGYDLGALDLFEHLKPLSNAHFHHLESRLLIELNRSLHHPQLFSEISSTFSAEAKQKLIKTYYEPYREAVKAKISEYIKEGEEVLHLSVHSFTPVFKNEKRTADIGLLYDPARLEEKNFCKKFKEKLQKQSKQWEIKMNYPYLGKADGFTTFLRKEFPKQYLGIELEVNQKFSENGKMNEGLKNVIFQALQYNF